MTVGLFGGTFDPPHSGHTRLASLFYEASGVDLLIVMPSYLPPHKASSDTSAEDRLAMTRLAFLPLGQNGVNYTVSDYEITQGGKSYTYLTVRHLLEVFSLSRLSLCVGSDMLFSFDTWKNADELMRCCRLFTMARHENELAPLRERAAFLKDTCGADVTVLTERPLDVSSTSLRDSLAESGTFADTDGQLDEKVLAYCKSRHLYHLN